VELCNPPWHHHQVTAFIQRSLTDFPVGASALAKGIEAMTTMNEPSLLTFGKQPAVDRSAHLTIGGFVFPDQDQIDFTGPFEVLSRIPNSTFIVLGKTLEPIGDVKGLLLTPMMTIAEAPQLDVLLVPGGLGQKQIMNDEEIIGLIQRQAAAGRYVFSVCTGALLCGAAGLLRRRHATTHWAAKELLPLYGAIPTDARVVIDGNYVSSAGVTAGLDGALEIAALLRGKEVAEKIQLEIEYAPNPHFHSGTPATASKSIVDAFYRQYGHNRADRKTEAERFAIQLGITLQM
jgi:cyclohexyl-isocyanide hydratase